MSPRTAASSTSFMMKARMMFMKNAQTAFWTIMTG